MIYPSIKNQNYDSVRRALRLGYLYRAMIRLACLLCLPLNSWAVEGAASGVPNTVMANPNAAPIWVQVVIFGVVILILLVSLIAVKDSLRGDQWSLAHALSEETLITTTTRATPDASPSSISNTQMIGSASRLIAFLGMLVILSFFVGVGLWLLWQLLSSGKVPANLELLLNFFAGGAMLFVPYLANQFKAMLGNVTK